MIEIYDNLLEEDHVKRVRDTLISPSFPWYYQPTTVYGENDTPSLCHNFEDINAPHIHRSAFYSFPTTLLDLFSISTGYEIEKVIRIRANLVLPTNIVDMTLPHVDYPDKHHVILYYVNDTDGNTVFLNEDESIRQEVEPKAGRFAIFDGSILHCLRMPTATRAVFNYNVILK
ncbi:hypothetical protein UFOVP240_87 [uncultured Caudovirales phage]|uniref:Oxoglutarate/iron-dependent dioxygenase n=1 Tax=uncultured Caudovirales phage TaxID=2100421 RepID=A0A6J7X1H7_9CAUD|nr:hypothetical protein UFOVP240_87 [uncultured Caudovirales phage]